MTTGEVEEIPVRLVGPGPLVRAERVDLLHVKALAEIDPGTLPPIDVRRTTAGYSLIDGQHRLSAQKLAVRETIRAVVHEVDEPTAYEMAVAANLAHGKPLSVAERKACAERFIADHADWSNVRVAAASGLSDKTIATLRPSNLGDSEVGQRTGGDGRSRPVDPEAQRTLIIEAIAADPEASNREIQRRTGAGSVMTVIKVREEIDKDSPDEDAVTSPVEEPAPDGAEADDHAEGSAAESSEGTPDDADTSPASSGDPYPDLTYSANAKKASARLREDLGIIDPPRLAGLAPTDERSDWTSLADALRAKADEIDEAFARPRLEVAR